MNIATALPRRPLPEISALTRPFWAAAATGALVVQRCLACGHLRFPPGPVCTQCLDERSDWTPLSGRGSVLSHLVFHQGYDAIWRQTLPYSVVMLQLDEGPRMFSDIDDPQRRWIEDDLVGRRVEVWFDPISESIAVPRFRVVE
ncbi:MAG: OB-fold domain-containing protein [Burkholderiaceae bacterium]|nr:OB-fold domain-containing protein [Burkholderiaceae bacterium]